MKIVPQIISLYSTVNNIIDDEKNDNRYFPFRQGLQRKSGQTPYQTVAPGLCFRLAALGHAVIVYVTISIQMYYSLCRVLQGLCRYLNFTFLTFFTKTTDDVVFLLFLLFPPFSMLYTFLYFFWPYSTQDLVFYYCLFLTSFYRLPTFIVI